MSNDLDKGITRNGEGQAGKSWNILGQTYYPKAVCDSSFAFETNSAPGQFVPVHLHPTQDEFILVQEGVLDLKLDGEWSQARAGDLVRMPRGFTDDQPHADAGVHVRLRSVEAGLRRHLSPAVHRRLGGQRNRDRHAAGRVLLPLAGRP